MPITLLLSLRIHGRLWLVKLEQELDVSSCRVVSLAADMPATDHVHASKRARVIYEDGRRDGGTKGGWLNACCFHVSDAGSEWGVVCTACRVAGVR
jgi:hypothetical protein